MSAKDRRGPHKVHQPAFASCAGSVLRGIPMRRTFAVCWLAALLPSLSLAALFVSANKPVFVWGESVKVSAILTDETGRALPMGPVTWSVDVPANATVAADGTVTPRAMQSFLVRGSVNGQTGEVRLQPVPKQIVVVPESVSMMVGATQRMRADVLDLNDRPIPNVPVIWSVGNQLWGNTASATIDAAGMLTALMQARVRVSAQIQYSTTLPGFDQAPRGETLVDIKLPVTYRFERIYVARTVAKAGGAASSKLAPRPATLVPTESGGFMFAASLDGLGSALLEWKDGAVKPLLASGRANIQSGYPLSDFLTYTRTPSGEVLTQEADTRGGFGTLVSRGPADGITPLLSDTAPLFGASSTYSFDITRNSLADSGAMIVRAGYTDAVTNRSGSGLFRGFGRGYSEPVITNIDDHPDPADAQTQHFGIADDGTAWFATGNGLWRSRPGEKPKKMLAIGGQFDGGTIISLAGNFSGNPNLFVSSNGDVVTALNTSKGYRYLLYHQDDETPSDVLILTAPANGMFWHDPKVGALIDTTLSRGRGLYLWNKDGAKPLLTLNDTSLDGSPVQEIISAACTSDGTIYAMARTANNLMLIARLAPNPAVLLRAGDSVPVAVPPIISALIPGARKGMPLVIAGGQTGSIAQLNDAGDLNAIVPIGVRLPDQKFFVGSQLSGVRTVPDGRIIFAQNLFASGAGIYTWNNGTIDLALRTPLTTSAGTRPESAQAFDVNRRGDIAVRMGFGAAGIFFVRDGRVTQVAIPEVDIDGIKFSLNNGTPALDESGNVLFRATTADGSVHYVVWDGARTRIVLNSQTKMPDGRMVTGLASSVVKGCEDSFLVGMLDTYGRYRNGNWEYLAPPTEPLATGAPAINVSNSLFDANRSCDVVFAARYGTDLETRAQSKFQEIQDLYRLTPDGELLTVVQVLINDDGTVYVLGANDIGEEVIYRATPIQ